MDEKPMWELLSLPLFWAFLMITVEDRYTMNVIFPPGFGEQKPIDSALVEV